MQNFRKLHTDCPDSELTNRVTFDRVLLVITPMYYRELLPLTDMVLDVMTVTVDENGPQIKFLYQNTDYDAFAIKVA